MNLRKDHSHDIVASEPLLEISGIEECACVNPSLAEEIPTCTLILLVHAPTRCSYIGTYKRSGARRKCVLLTFNVSAQGTMKSAARCDNLCEMLMPVNQLNLEHQACLHDFVCNHVCIICSHRMQQGYRGYFCVAARYDSHRAIISSAFRQSCIVHIC